MKYLIKRDLYFGFILLVLLTFSFGCMKMNTDEDNLYVSKYADNRDLNFLEIKILTSEIEKYSLFEVIVRLQGTYANPFDQEEISLEGIFRGPDNKEIVVPGFFYQEFERELRDNIEYLNPVGEPHFRIRFSPEYAGEYKFYIVVSDKTGKKITSNEFSFKVKDSTNKGYVRVSKKDFRYFEFDCGDQYIPIGANICWASSRGTFDYDLWLPEYKKVGCNYFRVWLGPSWTTFALEKASVREYDLKNAWRLDYILKLAERLNMYVMLCFDSYNELRYQKEGAYPFWEFTPHNKANGGPLNEPKDFWANKEMEKYYKNKLRYIVARYSYSPNIFAWEFWNEVDIISPTAFHIDNVKNWHKNMAIYLKSIDPWNHLVTTSFAYSPGKPEIDSLNEIDFVQTHLYQSRGYIDLISNLVEYKERYKKPHLIGEFGLDAGGKDPFIDPKGHAIHNAIWSSILSGSSGSAMSWWWDNHIHPNNLYFHFHSLVKFIDGVNFLKENFVRIEDIKVINTKRNLKLVGLKGRNSILLWVYDSNKIYKYNDELSSYFGREVIGRVLLQIEGNIKVSYYDPYNGEVIEYRELYTTEGFYLDIINFERDLAIKIQKLNEGGDRL